MGNYYPSSIRRLPLNPNIKYHRVCKNDVGKFLYIAILRPHQESNPDLLLRRESFYPLNYGDFDSERNFTS